MFPTHKIKRLTILCSLVLLQTGCAKESLKHYDTTQNGADMQKAGIMSQATYIRVDELGHKTYQTHTISDSDLEWTINLLRTGGNSVVRSRAMTILSEIRPMSPTQKALIVPAIAPYLNSSDRLDYLYAKRVEKAIQSS